ncbi:MAG TPA: YdeI/OmpD-associated family protein [Chitinophagaceae bacterium]
MQAPDKTNSFYAKDRKAWRKWLEKNHSKAEYVWLNIYHKGADTPSVYYEEAVEEALCFGWIDSKPNKKGDDNFYLFFTKRKPKSKWSRINKNRIEKLQAEGKMAPAGLEMVELAKKSGTWTALEKIDRMEIPEDLQKAFAANKTAKKYFDLFPPSTRKQLLEWVENAKRPETRNNRIREIVTLAAKNIRANQYTPKK